MSYSIQHMTLTRAEDGKTESGEIACAYNLCELYDYIEGYKNCKHDYPAILLSENLTKQFALWQLAFEEQLKPHEKRILTDITKVCIKAITGHGMGALTGTFKYALHNYQAIQLERELKRDNYEFGICKGHLQTLYTNGKMAICMYKFRDGSTYKYGTGQGWNTLYKRINGQRPI